MCSDEVFLVPLTQLLGRAFALVSAHPTLVLERKDRALQWRVSTSSLPCHCCHGGARSGCGQALPPLAPSASPCLAEDLALSGVQECLRNRLPPLSPNTSKTEQSSLTSGWATAC